MFLNVLGVLLVAGVLLWLLAAAVVAGVTGRIPGPSDD